ncbi:MAG: hypothetical protein E6J91_38245 [Deltaproteobacteria bacterium]|nr:MAG: hypothetical protein E6J91_38245 [Deltaproteobacteria bacterium]
MRTAMMLVAAAAALGACKWTEFDDLSGQTWVSSTEKPGVRSADYGVAIQRGKLTSPSGGALVVIGANQPTYSQLDYSAQGDAKLDSTIVDLGTQGIGNLDAQPIVLADPTGDNAALIANGGGSSILVLIGTIGTTAPETINLFVTPTTVDAATYVQPPNRPDNNQPQPARPLIASGDIVTLAYVTPQPNPQPVCKLVDGTTAIKPQALGAWRNGMYDEVLAWGANGKLYRYPSSVSTGCVGSMAFTASHDTGFSPGKGSQILPVDANHVLLQGHHDVQSADDAALLQVYDATTLLPVGGSVSLPKLRTAATGQVKLFKVSGTGIESSPSATLNDAQPEDNQSFGRAVAAMPFNGTPVIAVAADNEIFMYFQAKLTSGAMLYNETRQGR